MLPIIVLTHLMAPMIAVNEPAIADQPIYSLADSLSARAPAYEPLAAFPPAGGMYVRLEGGITTTSNSDSSNEDVDFDEGYLLGIALGQRATSGAGPLNFSLELEGLWSQQDASNSGALQAVDDVTAAMIFLNGLLEYQLMDRLSIYGGAGLGVAWVDVGTNHDGTNDFTDEDGPFFAWQARTGVQWQFTPGIAGNFGYRFINIDDVNLDDNAGGASFDLSTRQHVLEVGVRFGI